jgi:NTE family protein
LNQDSFKKRKVALHLLGGGVTGAFFHYGALAALDDHLSQKSVQADIFTGVSAGSLVASSTANGLTPQRIVDAIMKDDREIFMIRRSDIYRFSVRDLAAESLKFVWAFFYLLFSKVQDPMDSPSLFWGLKDSLPSGLFSLRYYENWIKEFYENKELPRFFSQISKELYIPAHDLDSTRRVIFGSAGWKHVPIYKAIAASSSIPIFFKPVQIEDRYYIDGGLGSMAHLDISAEAGAQLILVINPMVPVDNTHSNVKIQTVFDEAGNIKDKGLTYVFDQGLRSEIYGRVHTAIHYLGYRNPDVDILLIEPDKDDATMFLFNPMDFNSRRQIIEYAYELTRRKLKEQSELWKRTLDRHQITVLHV